MPPRSRYAVDPSLTAQASQQPPPQPEQWQSPAQGAGQPSHFPPYPPSDHADASANPQLHHVSERTSAPTGPYAPSGSQTQTHHTITPQTHAAPPSMPQPANHIPAPPHSTGPSLAGPRIRIDPSQMPNPIEAQEMDQNLYDDEDFLSCQTRGLIPLAGTDWRGVDQGGSAGRVVYSRRREFSSSPHQSHSDRAPVQWAASRYHGAAVWPHHPAFRSAAVRRGAGAASFQLGLWGVRL
ncbi:COPII coat Sec23p-Sfb3p heterodimer component [Saitozyma podzolica]|jgi:protein transport protein SEC24|uniref:COPII coat Sec23p-Sfb3p heterodimer component n=1 Tax=Saitozyma podzolica TaxID=1890683 RepID=A0A427Y7H2_9TREE|nr:COPII coat Sec23p-Sfb3p heterodimer component [Saitozyma podzolica]